MGKAMAENDLLKIARLPTRESGEERMRRAIAQLHELPPEALDEVIRMLLRLLNSPPPPKCEVVQLQAKRPTQ
jgi:hypothetical protein